MSVLRLEAAGCTRVLIKQRTRWNRTLSTYSFRLAFPNVSPGRNYVLAASFDRNAGQGAIDLYAKLKDSDELTAAAAQAARQVGADQRGQGQHQVPCRAVHTGLVAGVNVATGAASPAVELSQHRRLWLERVRGSGLDQREDQNLCTAPFGLVNRGSVAHVASDITT